jgi:putative hydrolase of the HAD superfamily
VTLRAVTFDYWQTLVSERRGEMRDLQIARCERALDDAGQPRSTEALRVAFAENWEVFERHWRDNAGPYGYEESVRSIAERLGVRLTAGLRDRLERAFLEVGETAPLFPAPGVAGCLATLRSAGVRLGIVCDVGLTPSSVLRRRLEGFGLLRYFEAWAFSDETGWFKPAAAAFQPVLDSLGVEPAEAAHVGDNERTDVAGAKALGMVSVQYTGMFELAAWLPEQAPGGMADHVIDDHAELPAVLGLT